MATKAKQQRSRKVNTVERRARRLASILTAIQVRNGSFEDVDVANHTDGDQRHSMCSGERRTLRRTPKLQTEAMKKILSDRERAACQWYADAYAMRYDTTGITARYGESSGGGNTSFDHMPKNREQQEALDNFDYARAGINPAFLGMFERVVLHHRPLGKLAITFRTAARQLLARIEGRVQL
jgi:hypothetical protein